MTVQDLRLAVRNLRNRPGFALVALASLALGIGANSSIFSFVNSILLAPLPFADSQRVVEIQDYEGARPANGNPVRLLEWGARSQTLEAVTGGYLEDFTVLNGDTPERVRGIRSFGSLLDTFAIRPMVGRPFTREEEQGRGAVVLISHGMWKSRFQGDPAIAGRKITLNGKPHEIIGVLPEGADHFRLSVFAAEPVQSFPRGARFISQTARLKPGVPLEQAQADLERLAQNFRTEYPATDKGLGVRLTRYQETVVEDVRTPLLVLMSAVGLVLLIACLNIAGLALYRTAGRKRELAIRQALGATRSRLAGTLLAESLVLGIAGGAAGLLLAFWGVDFLRWIMPADVPRLSEVRLDWRVVAFAAALSLFAAFASGWIPAWQGSRMGWEDALRTARGASRRQWIAGALVVGEIAFSAALLIGAGMLLRSFWNLQQQPLGFRNGGLLTFRFSFPWQSEQEQVNGAYQRILDALREIPGVQEAALVDRLPRDGGSASAKASIEGRDPAQIPSHVELFKRSASVNYLRMMGVPLKAGRYLEESDRGLKRTVINESAARQYFDGMNPIGQRIGLEWKGAKEPPNVFEIVGVVANLPFAERDAVTPPAMYVGFEQMFWPISSFVVRTDGDPLALAGAIRAKVASLDRSRALERMQTMDDFLFQRAAQPRLQTGFVTVFALLALGLAAIGIYGLLANTVADRAREIGIRMALGAEPGDVIRGVLRQTGSLVIAGGLLGVAGGLALSRAMGKLLFGLAPDDPFTFSASLAVLVGVALLASWLPARRASRLDPAEVLRRE